MSNEIVKYNNRMNSFPLGALTANELNLFMSLVQQSYQKGTQKFVLTFDQLKKLSKYKRSNRRFIQDITTTNAKLLSVNGFIDNGVTIKQFVVFNTFVIDRKKQTVTISVNPDFQGLFNDLKHWTRFQLKQFNELNSAYSKNIFRLIKQYRTTGHFRLSKKELFKQLQIPKSYAKSSANLDKRVFSPIKNELSPIIRGFSINSVHSNAIGHPTIAYEFTWHPESAKADDFEKSDLVERQAKLNNISLNDTLSSDEKAKAYDRILGNKPGTTDAKKWHDLAKHSQKSQKELEKRIQRHERSVNLMKLYSNWATKFGDLSSQTTKKLSTMMDLYGLSNVQSEIDRYAVLSSSDIEVSQLLDLMESSLKKKQDNLL